MNNKDLHETLKAIGRTPDTFRRDTPLLLKTLEKMGELVARQPENMLKSSHATNGRNLQARFPRRRQ